MYCVTKNSHILLISHLFVHFYFSPMKFSVTDFSAPFRASVFKFCVHLRVGLVFCVNENNDKAHFAFFYYLFLIFPFVTPIKQMDIFRQSFLSNYLI